MKNMIFLFAYLIPVMMFAQSFPSSYGWSHRDATSDSSMLIRCFILNDSIILVSRQASFVKDGQRYMRSYINKSSDAGRTWNIIYERRGDTIPYQANFQQLGAVLCFNDKWYRVHAGDSNEVIETHDGGVSWEVKYLQDKNGRNTKISQFKVDNGRILGLQTVVLKKVDNESGEISTIFHLWKNSTLPHNYAIADYGFAGDSMVYAFVMPTDPSLLDRYLFKSNNLGSSWDSIRLPDTVQSVYFFTEKIGWLTKSKTRAIPGAQIDAIYKTIDGGYTWVEQRYKTESANGRMNNVRFWNENEGIALGIGRYFTTSNGGNTWEEDSINPYRDSYFAPTNSLPKYHQWVIQSLRLVIFQFCEKMLPVSEPVATPLLAVPTPFTDEARIEFDVEQAGAVSVLVRNSMGELVAQREYYSQSGRQSFSLAGAELPAGIYFCDIVANGKTYRAKAVLVR